MEYYHYYGIEYETKRYPTLLCVLLRHKNGNSLTALHALDLNVREVCNNVKILYDCSKDSDSCCSRVSISTSKGNT